MKYAKIMVIIVIFVFAMSVSCAADTNNASISEDNSQMLLSLKNEITDDTSENSILAQTNNDETLSAQKDNEILRANEGTYEDLRNDINNGGSLTKSYYRYQPGNGETIEIGRNDFTVNGNGAVIDMSRSRIRAFEVTGSGVTFKNLTIKNANFNGNGGAIYFSLDGTVENCNFTGNTATGTDIQGGAVYIGHTGDVRNCNFTANTATEEGGAVYIERTGDVRNCNFTDNQAKYGGAVFFSWDGTVSNCNFTGNTATLRGGAVYFSSSGTVSNCNFTGNTATRGDGGAVYWQGSNGVLSGSSFTGNNAELGGAVRWDGAGGVLSGSNFNGNNAELGGAVYWKGSNGNLTGSNFTGNNAVLGGAVSWVGDNGTLSGSSFTGNNASSNGGAVCWNGDNSNINATFINNTAKGDGGAIYVNKFLASTVTGTYINNTAREGTIYFGNIDKLYVEIKNAIFLNNKCGHEISANSWHSDIVVNDCWFGNNANNFKTIPRTVYVQMKNWLFLNATADYTSLLVMDSTNITFKLNSTNGTCVFGFDNSKLPVVNLTLTASNGDVDKTTTLDRAVKYMATKYGKGSVTASIENAEYTIFLENRLNPKFSAEVNPQEIDYGNNTKIFLFYNDTATGTVNITLTGKKYSQKIENVDLNKTIKLPNTILPDEYEVTVTYSGDKVFANASATSALTVNKLKSDIKVVGHDIYVNETRGLMFNVTLPGNATGNLSISNGTILNVTKEGRKENNSLIIDIMNNAYPVGKYGWTFTYSGDDIYESSEETSVANILIIPTAITANVTSKLFVDNTTQVSYNLTPDGAVGDIIFTSNDTGVVEVDQNGNIKAIAEGTALITVNFEGSQNYAASSTDVTITVSKIPTEIIVFYEMFTPKNFITQFL